MYAKLIAITAFILSAFGSHAQYTLTGKVVSQKSQEPIAFANIGIINTSVGTCGYEDGTFKLIVPKHMVDQKITFSAIGYTSSELKIDTLNLEKAVVAMKENTTVLQEIQIRPGQRVNTGLVGRKSPGKFNRWGEALASSSGGSAWAMKIKVPKKVIDVKKVSLHIFRNDLDSFKIRCRILSIGPDQLPDQDLLGESVIIESKVKRGWVSVDFTPYQLSLSEDFFLVFEWIMDKRGAEIAAEHESNALPWKLPHSDIWNNNLMVYLNEEGKLIKQPLTEEQQQQCIDRQFPQTWFGLRKTNTKGTNFSRKASMAPWIEQPAFDLVANIEYEYF